MEYLSFVTLDVFTLTPYEGNPLAIINIPASQRHLLTPSRKQFIAREFNLSESVFIHEQEDPTKREWVIDIYTTNDELPFAGHPTIGAACYVLGLQGHAGDDGKAVFVTKAGRIPIALVANRGWTRVQADIPHNVHIHKHIIGDIEAPIPGLSSHPKLSKAEMRAPIVSIVKGMTFLLVRLENLEMLALVENTSSELSFHGLLDAGWAEGSVARYYYVIEDGEASNGHAGNDVTRIRTRMLEEAMEDPATGSAACALGTYLALNGHGTRRFEIVQGVEMGRRSVIGVEVVIDESGQMVESVKLSGSAVQAMEGKLRI
jgi:PhzF family phenazine biosynthesis protein